MNWGRQAIDGRTIRMRVQRTETVRKARGPQRVARPYETRPFTPSLAPQQGIPIPSAETLAGDLGLTDREAQVARLLVWGDSNKAIATKLAIRPGTVRKHVEHVLRKTGASSRRTVMRTVLCLTEPI